MVVIERLVENFVIHVSMRQKYAVGVNNEKVYLNLKRIRELFVVKYQEEVNVKSAASGNILYPIKQEMNLKKQTHSHLWANPFIVLFVIEQ